MILTMIYPSNHMKEGEAVLFAPDGNLVMSAKDFKEVVDYLNRMDLKVTQLNKRPKDETK